jgi:hypothetical protein
MRQSDAIWIITLLLPWVILSLRRHFLAYLLCVLVPWALWIIHDWDPKADNNWGAATIAFGWLPIALYCAFCYGMITLLCRCRRGAAGVGENGKAEADERRR